jgi:catechol-2,3-dioxygenase
VLDAPAEVPGGLWFRDHEGNLVNLRDEGIAPWRDFGTTDAQDANVGDRVRRIDRARWLNAGEKPRPQRLGHMLIFSSDLDASEAFYTRTLGLRLSDRIRSIATFMNSGPGDHHVWGRNCSACSRRSANTASATSAWPSWANPPHGAGRTPSTKRSWTLCA